MKRLLATLALLLMPIAAHAATCAGYTYTLTNGQLADANQVMADFNVVRDCVNNNVLSNATAAATYAPLISPPLLGVPTAPTAAAATSTTQIATTAFTTTAVNAKGLQSNGQLSLSTNTTLSSTQQGANTLVSGAAVTLTFPSTTGTYALSNTDTTNAITLAFPGTNDFRTKLYPGEQVIMAGDGAGNWHVVAQGVTSVLKQSSQSAAYAFALSDAGGQVYHPSADTTARIWTLPANASVAFPVSTKIDIVNDCSAGALTLAITTDTLVWLPSGTAGSRTLSACGEATLTHVTATRWLITGTGLS